MLEETHQESPILMKLMFCIKEITRKSRSLTTILYIVVKGQKNKICLLLYIRKLNVNKRNSCITSKNWIMFQRMLNLVA